MVEVLPSLEAFVDLVKRGPTRIRPSAWRSWSKPPLFSTEQWLPLLYSVRPVRTSSSAGAIKYSTIVAAGLQPTTNN